MEKLLFLSLSFFVCLTCASSIQSLGQERVHLKMVLRQIGNITDGTLVQLFPQLNAPITKFFKNIDSCYDKTIAPNQTVNIFTDKIHVVIETFFKSHGQFLSKLTPGLIHKRIDIFIENLKNLAILVVNCLKRKENGKDSMKLGVTSMAFYSREEIETQMLNLKLNETDLADSLGKFRHGRECSLDAQPNEIIPARLNWADAGVVSPAIMQKGCGACYVIATTSAMESQYMILHKEAKKVRFSIQATLNCMANGCKGGSLKKPLRYFIDRGVVLAHDGDYHGHVEKCIPAPTFAKAERFCHYSNLREKDMQRLLMRNGPAAVALDVHSDEFSSLKNSPYTGKCGRRVSHAVLLVGWNEHYWIIRNSWGESWGINGYLHLPRGSNKCGVQALFGQPILKK